MLQTMDNIPTRDRKKDNPLPKYFQVTNVERAGRKAVLDRFKSAPGRKDPVPPQHHAITRDVADKILESWGMPVLADGEELLWHGTTRDKAEKISGQGFRARRSDNSFVGEAVYFAESITKADEYTEPGAKVVLLARVRVGRPAVCDAKDPSTAKDTLRQRAKQSTGCVLLDRKSAVDTYREWAMMYGVQCLPCLLVSYATSETPFSASPPGSSRSGSRGKRRTGASRCGQRRPGRGYNVQSLLVQSSRPHPTALAIPSQRQCSSGNMLELLQLAAHRQAAEEQEQAQIAMLFRQGGGMPMCGPVMPFHPGLLGGGMPMSRCVMVCRPSLCFQ